MTFNSPQAPGPSMVRTLSLSRYDSFSHPRPSSSTSSSLDNNKNNNDDGVKIPAHEYSSIVVFCISIGYMFAMGVCGFIIVALGTTLSDIAANVGYSAYDIGTVFMARGVGCITGTMASSVLYGHYNGKHMLSVTSTVTVLILYWMPYCRDYYLLHMAYFALGMITSITETGSQLMMIKFHGAEAGPWCGANSMAFCISGILVPGVEILTPDLYTQYTCYAAFVGISAVWVIACPDPEKNGRILPQTVDEDNKNNESQHYNVEILISLMIFLMIGGGESILFYIKIYVTDTGVLPSEDGSMIILMFFIAVTVGKVLGILDQAYLTNETIVMHFFVLLMGSAVSLGAIWYYPDDANMLWLGIVGFGLCQGPAISYCFDLCNRLALCSEVSISILMLGMNLGVSIVPYCASLLWSAYMGPMAIINVGIFTMLACIPVLFISPRLSYLKSIPYFGLVSHSSQIQYSPIKSTDTDCLQGDVEKQGGGGGGGLSSTSTTGITYGTVSPTGSSHDGVRVDSGGGSYQQGTRQS